HTTQTTTPAHKTQNHQSPPPPRMAHKIRPASKVPKVYPAQTARTEPEGLRARRVTPAQRGRKARSARPDPRGRKANRERKDLEDLLAQTVKTERVALKATQA